MIKEKGKLYIPLQFIIQRRCLPTKLKLKIYLKINIPLAEWERYCHHSGQLNTIAGPQKKRGLGDQISGQYLTPW